MTRYKCCQKNLPDLGTGTNDYQQYAAAIVEDPKADMIDKCSILKYVDLPIKV